MTEVRRLAGITSPGAAERYPRPVFHPSQSAPALSGVSRLLALHAELDELFALHQELVLVGRLEEAGAALHAHRVMLELHMRHEEELLLPRFAEHERSARWPARLYTGQHVKLRQLLDIAAASLGAMPPAAGARCRATLALLDLETSYRRLSEHHDQMERRGLFPALERCLERAEQDAIVEHCLREWDAAAREIGAVLARARSELDRL